MDKNSALAEVESWIKQGVISHADLLSLSPGSALKAPESSLAHKLTAADLFYYVGGLVVFLGIGILVEQNWDLLNTFTKVLVTLGSAVAAYAVAAVFDRSVNLQRMGTAFYMLSGLLFPLGLHITLRQAGYDIGSSAIQTVISLILTAIFSVSFVMKRRAVFVIFTILFSSWLFFAMTQYLVSGVSVLSWFRDWHYYAYRILILGFAYLSLGYYFSDTDLDGLKNWLYALGTVGFLTSALALGGYSPEQNMFWELIFPVLVFAFIFASISVRSTAMLIFSALFLMGDIIKISAEYFANSIGWSFALVIIGLALIAVGYLTIHLRKKYINP